MLEVLGIEMSERRRPAFFIPPSHSRALESFRLQKWRLSSIFDSFSALRAAAQRCKEKEK